MAEEKQMDILDQNLEEMGEGGGGQVCQIALYGAYKVFLPQGSGIPLRDTLFLFTDKKEQTKAKTDAEAFAAKHEVKAPQLTVALVRFKDSVLTHSTENWQGDQFQTYGPNWRSNADYKWIIGQVRGELGIPTGKKVWARVAWVVSPNIEENKDKDWAWRRDERDPTSEPRLKTSVFPVEVYASKKDAVAAAEGLAVSSGPADPTYPGEHTGWTLAVWQSDGKPGALKAYQDAVAALPAPMRTKTEKLEEVQVEVCNTYEIKTESGEPDVEKLRLLLAEAAV